MTKIKIGFGEVDFTPKGKIKLSGQFFERISDEVESPIGATAVAIENGSDQVILCSCDLCAITEALLKKVRENLKGVKELDAEKVIISATHTHTSYVYSDGAENNSLRVLQRYMPEGMQYVPLAEGEAMDPYEAYVFLAEKIAEAIRKAWENRTEGYMAPGFGRAAIGMCRRVVYNDGTAKMWGDVNHADFVELEGGNDSGIEFLYCFDANKKVTGAVINIACPSQVVEQRSFISSDYWGKLKMMLREEFGEDIFVVGLCAPAGDQCPRDLVRWVEPETPVDDPNVPSHELSRRADPSMYDVAGTWKVAKRIKYEFMDALEEAKDRLQDTAVLKHMVDVVNLPLRRATITEYEDAKKKISAFFENCGTDVDFGDLAQMHVYAGLMHRYEMQQQKDLVPVELHVLRLGDMALCTNPFELFLDFGNLIRARSLAKQTFLVQLACGSDGYLPTEKAERGSHYSAYISSGKVGHEGGEQLVRESLERIRTLFQD